MITHVLKASMERGLTVTIMYCRDGQVTRRDIRVIAMDGSHIRAYCHLRRQVRVFRLENILSAAFAAYTADGYKSTGTGI